MDKEVEKHIRIKIAISLNELLLRSKNYSLTKNSDDLAKSYNKIALEAEIRKATVNDAFNAKSKTTPKSATIILIIEAMGFKLVDFSDIYHSIKDIEIEDFKKKQGVFKQ